MPQLSGPGSGILSPSLISAPGILSYLGEKSKHHENVAVSLLVDIFKVY